MATQHRQPAKGPAVPQERSKLIFETERRMESEDRLLRSGRFWEGVGLADIEAARRKAAGR